MISSYDVYGLYRSLSLHFTSDSYDAIKFKFKVRGNLEKSFLKRKDRFFFVKLSRKVQLKSEAMLWILMGLVSDKTWIGDIVGEETEKLFNGAQRYLSAPERYFTNDLVDNQKSLANPKKMLDKLDCDEVQWMTCLILYQIGYFQIKGLDPLQEDICDRLKILSDFMNVNTKRYLPILQKYRGY